jgi:hypothetical protein
MDVQVRVLFLALLGHRGVSAGDVLVPFGLFFDLSQVTISPL